MRDPTLGPHLALITYKNTITLGITALTYESVGCDGGTNIQSIVLSHWVPQDNAELKSGLTTLDPNISENSRPISKTPQSINQRQEFQGQDKWYTQNV